MALLPKTPQLPTVMMAMHFNRNMNAPGTGGAPPTSGQIWPRN